MLISQPDKIFISSANVDMRKSIDGLSSIVEQCFQLSQFDDAMFVFHNRYCDKIKILYWDSDGFCLLYKRIEHGKFCFPQGISGDKYSITKDELLWLLHGLKIEEIHKYNSLESVR